MSFFGPILKVIKDTWKIWMAAILVLGGIYAVYDPERKWIESWLQDQIMPGGGKAGPSLKVLPSHLIAGGVLLGFFLIIVTGAMAVALRRGLNERLQRDALLQTFDQSTKASDLICEQLFPSAAVPIKKVLSFKEVFTFYENGDCYCQQEWLLTSDTSDVHFYEMSIEGEDVAAPANYPKDIQLEVSPGAKQSLAYLISANEPRKKKLVIFFLPFIRGGSSDQRTVNATYYWRGLMRKLFTEREEEFNDQVKSSAPVPEIKYEFWIKPGMGNLTCKQIGGTVAGETLVEASPNLNGMKGWIYTAPNVPVGHETRLRLILS